MKGINSVSRTLRVGFEGIRNTVDESAMDWSFTPEMFNYRIEDGVLTGGIGLMAASGFHQTADGVRRDYPALPAGVEVAHIFHYRRRSQGNYDDRLVIGTSTGAIYYTAVFASDTWHLVEGYTLQGDASAVCYNYDGKDVLLLCSEGSPLAVLDDGTVTTVTSAPRFTSVTVHNERVYGTVSGTSEQLWFSDNFDPENWTVSGDEAGYISFQDECGDALAAVSFLGYLYIFREHGIHRLTAYGDQSEFSLKKLFTATGRIYKHTIALCGDRIMFLTDEGIFSFDGYSATPAVKEFPDIEYPSHCRAAYHDGAYWLSCFTDIGELAIGVCTTNALVRCDLRDGSLAVLAGEDILTMCAVRSHTADDIVFAVDTDEGCRLASVAENGLVFGTPTPKIYRSPYGDLFSSALKTVLDVTLTTRFAAELRVITDGEAHSFELPASDAPQTVFVGKSGVKIGIELRSFSGLAHIIQPVVRLKLTAGR